MESYALHAHFMYNVHYVKQLGDIVVMDSLTILRQRTYPNPTPDPNPNCIPSICRTYS